MDRERTDTTEAYLAGKPCPKCRYVRVPADTNPDWQCPRCHIAYAKVDAGRANLSSGRLAARLTASGREIAGEAKTDRSVYGLLAANLVALWIAVAQGMSLRELMYVYWMQSVMIGVSSLVRLLSLATLPAHDPKTDADSPEWVHSAKSARLRKWMTPLRFVLGYGVFHLFYLFFLLSRGDFMAKLFGAAPGPLSEYWSCVLAFAVAHGFSLLENLKRDREGLVDAETLEYLPLLRILPMHLILIAPAFFGKGAPLFYGFAALKIAVDVAMHSAEHHILRTGHLLSQEQPPDPEIAGDG